jgi:type III pantothenate kinase
MILCDIGNTHFHFCKSGKIFDEIECSLRKEKIYFISVNNRKRKELLKKNPDSIDLGKYVTFESAYEGLGIDRIMACKTVEDGVVIDAGTAITIDIMAGGLHLGGYILPGLNILHSSYKKVSEKLDYPFISDIDLKLLPINTSEAINYGFIGMVVSMIEKVSKNKKLYFTGGDGAYLSKFFTNGIYMKNLVFQGMIKTIKENNL